MERLIKEGTVRFYYASGKVIGLIFFKKHFLIYRWRHSDLFGEYLGEMRLRTKACLDGNLNERRLFGGNHLLCLFNSPDSCISGRGNSYRLEKDGLKMVWRYADCCGKSGERAVGGVVIVYVLIYRANNPVGIRFGRQICVRPG